MNIYKKTILLMALCCSLGAPISAVDKSQPQDREVKITQKTTPKNSKSVGDFKKEIRATVNGMRTLLDSLNLKVKTHVENPITVIEVSHSMSVISKLEALGAAMAEHKSDIIREISSIQSSESLLQKDKYSQTERLDCILVGVINCNNAFYNTINKVLEGVTSELGKSHKLGTIKNILDEAKSNMSLDKFLEGLLKNTEKHAVNLQDLQVKANGVNDDSDQEMKEQVTDACIRTKKEIIAARKSILGQACLIFIGAKEDIKKNLTNFDRELS